MSYVGDPKRHYVLNLLQGGGGSQYVIPVYQRNYVWEPAKQVKDLLDDIKGILDKRYKNHFIGIIIYLISSGGSSTDKQFYVIDGQQRLTTIFLILYALKHLSIESNQNELSKEIKNYYLTNPYVEDNKLKMKLKPLMNDSGVYKKISENKISELTPEEKKSNVAKSYSYIYKYLEKLSKRYKLSEIKDSLNKLYLVDFPIGANDNAHQIYESINAKGYKLLSVDLIRNFVLMNASHEEKEMLFKNYWLPIENNYKDNRKLEKFFRFFVINRTRGFVSKNNIYNEFQSWFFSRRKTKSTLEIMEEIKLFSNYYLELYENDIKTINKHISKIIEEFRTITSDMPAPFMLEAYDMFINDELSNEEFKEVTTIIISYIVRRAIIGLDTSAISRFFTTLIKGVMDVKEEFNVDFVDATKIAIINKNINLGARFPSDNELKEQLKYLNVYAYKDALRWVFDKIENHNNPIPIDTKKLQIEHLLPQSESKWIDELGITLEEYENHLNRLGNLTLAAGSDNAKMSNNIFEYKKEILKSTNHLRINTEVYTLNKWDISEIDKRNIKLIDEIIKLYPYSLGSITEETELKKGKQNLPKMKELIKLGVLSPGMNLVITINPKNSKAKLIDDKYVEYKGENLTINEWGRLITGWSSINIYSYTSVEGENETLHDKRLRLVN